MQIFNRHRLVAVAGAFVAVVALPASLWLFPAAAPAAAGSAAPPSLAQQEAGMTPGLPFEDPPDLNKVTPRTLKVRLVAGRTRFNISGKNVQGESYNGDYAGPTLHVAPGEHVDLTLVNNLATATNLHFHGMHVSPSGSSDNVSISVPPGKSFTYHLAIPRDQPLGTFWYHDHDMCMGNEAMAMPGMTTSAAPGKGKGCQDNETQIYNGLSGTIVVGDDRSLLPPQSQHIPVHTLALKDMQITRSGHIVANSPKYSIDSEAPTVRLVNGKLRPVLTMRPGETQLWRISNEGADIFYDLALAGYTFTVVGQDGYSVAHPATADTLELPPAKRWDVLVTARTAPGTTWLKTLPIDTGPQGDSYPGEKLMGVRVAGPPAQRVPAPTAAMAPAKPLALPSLADAPIARHRTATLSENAAGTQMYINGREFDPSKSIFPAPAVLGTIEQWTIVNDSGETHPFHTHTDHFQVMSANGVPQPYNGEQDIVPVPPRKYGVPGRVVIRIHFTDFTGKVMFHCHIAAHEDAGMMSFVNVVPPKP